MLLTKKMKNKVLLFCLLFVTALTGFSQVIVEPEPNIKDTIMANLQEKAIATPTVAAPQMADTFRSEGKIYVVIAVLSIIFVCLTAYLIYIDIKVRRLEKKEW